MASYVNDLRLKEIGTGESSGTWGTETNTNLELIGDALGFGTEAITTNADTHTTTVADGSADAGRAMYIKYTGALDSACTITIGPNTINRMHFIENATTGSQNILISQGTGSNVTIPAGDVKAVYLDGAGSGAAVADAFTDLNLAGTTTVDALNVSGALTGSSTIQGTTITATTAFVPDASDGAALGTSSLEFSDLFLADAAVINLGDDQDTTLTHVADTGILLNSTRQLQFGDSGTYIHQSADGVLDLVSDTELELNATTIDMNGNLDLSGTINGISILADATNFTDSILISQNASTGTLSSATDNVGIGDDVFASLTSGRNSVAIGSNALDANTSGKNNVAVGHDALSANTTADGNTAVGKDALLDNTTGTVNTAIGRSALANNTTADNNTAVGREALFTNTTGANLTAVGNASLYNNTTASNNTAFGYQALFANTTGDQNTAVGGLSGDANTTGIRLTAIGFESLTANTTGNNNTALGHTALGNNTTGSQNVAVGYNTLTANTTVNNMTAVGTDAFAANTSGDKGVAIGFAALTANTTAVHNTAVGFQALTATTTGGNNTAVGKGALDANTTATDNTAMGVDALGANTTASANVAFGSNALASNTTGAGLAAFGRQALKSNTTANFNTAIGAEAMDTNTTGDSNTAVGYAAMDANTTGSNNVAIGRDALKANTTADSNTAVGKDALKSCIDGAANTVVGIGAGLDLSDGNQNTLIGDSAGENITTSSNNTCIGTDAGGSITTGSNNLALGHDALISGSPGGPASSDSNVVGLGDENISSLHCQVSLTVSSDQRDKTDFNALDLGLDFVKALNPVTYKWDKRSKYGNKKSDDFDLDKLTPDGTHKEDWLDVGFKAQEVETLEKAAGYNIDSKTNLTTSLSSDGKQYGLQYTKFIPILVKALQEADAKIEALTTRITTLEG